MIIYLEKPEDIPSNHFESAIKLLQSEYKFKSETNHSKELRKSKLICLAIREEEVMGVISIRGFNAPEELEKKRKLFKSANASELRSEFKEEMIFGYVKKENRNKGVFKRMISKIIQERKQSFFSTVNSKNIQALKVFKRMGFKQIGDNIGDLIIIGFSNKLN